MVGTTFTPSGQRPALPVAVTTISAAGRPCFPRVYALREVQQPGRSLVDVVAVRIAPGVDTAAERLGIEAEVADDECLEVVPGGFEIVQEVVAEDPEGGRADRGVDKVAGRRRAEPGPRAHVRLPRLGVIEQLQPLERVEVTVYRRRCDRPALAPGIGGDRARVAGLWATKRPSEASTRFNVRGSRHPTNDGISTSTIRLR